MVENALDVLPFTHDALTQSVCPGIANEELPNQVKYLARYCDGIKAQTIVIEHHYVDRHYLDEFALYYSRSFQAPPNHVRRIHLFGATFDAEALDGIISRSLVDPTGETDRAWRESYLGFIAVRPVLGVPVGRTILRCYPQNNAPRRDIDTRGLHEIHLGNIKLAVHGLPFQQQDQAVGACATAALWSALARVSRLDGMRAPTPADVSVAASRHILTGGRALPATAGLTVEQLCEAVRCCGLAPEMARADEHTEYFVAAIHTYLRSGIPVVLALQDEGGGHAVTAAGFQLQDTADGLLDGSVPLRSARLKKIYVHDDRIGPYASAVVHTLSYSEDLGDVLRLEIDNDDWDAPEQWAVTALLAPVYPKLRLSVPSLVKIAALLADAMETIIGGVGADAQTALNVEFEYERSGTYVRSLATRIDSSSADFIRRLAFSRWCAVIRWYLDDRPLAEFVTDTTDIFRDDLHQLLRAVVCLNDTYRPEFRTVAGRLGVPFASA